MRYILVNFIILIGLTTVMVCAQQISTNPFSALDEQVKKEQGGWAGHKQPFAQTFNVIRQKLGDKFEPELLKYIGTDVEKHYWISLFLESEYYLLGSKPLPHLSLLIKQQGLALCAGKNDEENQQFTVKLSVTAAVLSAQLGFQELAQSYKSTAVALLNKNSDLRLSMPAMTAEENKLYDSIKISSGNEKGIRR